MQKQAVLWCAAAMLCVLGAAQGLRAADASVSLDLASAYVYRGITLNDGMVAQPAVEVTGLPVTFGVWGNMDMAEYDGTKDKGEFSEIDLYASYSRSYKLLDMDVGYLEYTYPRQDKEADREVSVTAAVACLANPSLAFSYGVGGGVEKDLYIEAAVGHEEEIPLDIILNAQATLGFAVPDKGESGFSNYTVSLGAECMALSAEITYVGQIDDEVLADEDCDVEVYGTVGVSHEF